MGNEMLFLALLYIAWKVSQIHDQLLVRNAATRAAEPAEACAEVRAAADDAAASARPPVSTASD